ncbi:MAG: zeta toxin family protein [Candidatus Rokubacteria bacterium]|nr:zeta toxin family protein [Candidatus Rokubacteria bacterium]MBI4627905.1 zeta toxin family protein [Candidatus Rokubacteria bacterium]
MQGERPSVVVLAGPNGAGKSTMAAELLGEVLGAAEFVDADVIARSLPRSRSAAIPAGRAMLRRLDELGASRRDFGFETTLASRSLAPRIRTLIRAGYECHLVFLWLPNADLAVARVADRVRLGGHAVPELTIRRRYRSGLRNLFALYRPLTTTWRMYDNSTHELRLIASGAGAETRAVHDAALWERIRAEVDDEG